MSHKPFHVLYVLHSSNLVGGAFTGLFQLLEHLPRDKFHAYVVVPAKLTPEQKSILLKVVADVAVVKMGGGWTKSNRPFMRRMLSEAVLGVRTLFHLIPQLQLYQLIKRWNIDLVYTNGVMVMDGALSAYLTGRPHLWHIKERIGKNGNTQFFLPDRFLISMFDILSSQIVSMSHFIIEPFELYGKMDKVRVIYDGLDITPFQINNSGKALRRQLGFMDDDLVVGMVASLGAQWKQHDLFIEMASILNKQIPNVKFVHFGAIPPLASNHRPYYDRLCNIIEEYDLSTKFVFGGIVENIPQMMDTMDVLVHPCNVEPFGRVAIEAMAAGVPVVGPASGGIAESVADEVTGLLVKPGDPKSFAEATRRLLNTPDLRHRMGEAGQAYVVEKFSVEQHILQMVEVMNGMLLK